MRGGSCSPAIISQDPVALALDSSYWQVIRNPRRREQIDMPIPAKPKII